VSWWSRLEWELLLLASALPVPPALAEEGLKYDSSRGEGIVKTLSGALYIGLLLYFLFRVLNRRARKAREEVRQLSLAGPFRAVGLEQHANAAPLVQPQLLLPTCGLLLLQSDITGEGAARWLVQSGFPGGG
jgi:hypothetical protein